MLREAASAGRALHTITHEADLVVIGGGMAGVCGAITAARAGIKVVLVQDRPVLGGNASSEIRLWVLGATAHMGNNNRWSREGGVINELLVENLYRNREGNPVLFDTILLEYVLREPNLTLLLNTAVHEVLKADADTIRAVRGYCSQNETLYELRAPVFCDASGDGVVGFLAGAAFRMGAEAKEEFGEGFAPTGEFGHLLGHSIYFYSKDVGRPITFVPPSFALKNVPDRIPRFKRFNAKTHGCHLWWLEWGGRLDTIHETEFIKHELWKVAYGVWDYIKNSGNFPDAANLTLEWVGLIPGKRESRRFEGPHMLTQRDIVERRHHADAIAYGGWSIDLHPADGVFSALEGSHHLHAKGIYGIPYRCYYSRNIRNLYFAGRIISASHVAFGTIRVMATGAHGGQVAGLAAALCKRHHCLPATVPVAELQRELLRTGQHLPALHLDDPADIARLANITASSTLRLAQLPADGPPLLLKDDWAQMLPLSAGETPRITVCLDVTAATTLHVELRTTSRADHHAPDVTLASGTVALRPGEQQHVTLPVRTTLTEPRYLFVCLLKNPDVSVRTTQRRVTGLLTVRHGWDHKTAAVGGEDYEVWTPTRRPDGQNFALQCDPPLDAFGTGHLTNGLHRPTNQANAWLADCGDPAPALTLTWDRPHSLRRVELWFDVDYDHAMESVFYGHPENVVPFTTRRYRLRDAAGKVIAECAENHHARCVHEFATPVTTERLVVEVLEGPAAIFEVRCYDTRIGAEAWPARPQ